MLATIIMAALHASVHIGIGLIILDLFMVVIATIVFLRVHVEGARLQLERFHNF
jgi:hypothetical protein